MWIIIFVIVLVFMLYALRAKSHTHWKEKNVPYIKPLPIIGNLGPSVFRQLPFTEMVQKWYSTYPDQRYVGIYQFNSPTLLLRDPELIKKVTVKEFDTFPDHRTFASDDVDPLWTKNLAAMKGGERWQDMRSTLSPSFTSNKMRIMFGLMKDCAKQFSDHFLKQGGTVTTEMKDAFSRFSNDVIATTAFGVSCNSLENRENEFYLMGKDVSNFSGLRSLRFFMYTLSPTLMKLLRIGIISNTASRFFRKIVKETLQLREEQGIVRPDMLYLLTEARKGRLNPESAVKPIVDSGFAVVQEAEMRKSPSRRHKPEITYEDITAQALIFFLAGFESVSTQLSFAAYELAINPDIQEKLREEIDSALKECKGELTYEALLGMEYLDMVITETLRLWPPSAVSDRMSVKPYTIEPELPGEKSVTLDTNTNLWIPIFAIQRDPKYFPNPEKFDPERFNEENRQNIKPYTYLPFGSGPRNCIASRFALLESKLAIAEIVSKFEIVPVEQTPIPLKLDKSSFALKAEKGIWLGLKPRTSSHNG